MTDKLAEAIHIATDYRQNCKGEEFDAITTVIEAANAYHDLPVVDMSEGEKQLLMRIDRLSDQYMKRKPKDKEDAQNIKYALIVLSQARSDIKEFIQGNGLVIIHGRATYPDGVRFK